MLTDFHGVEAKNKFCLKKKFKMADSKCRAQSNMKSSILRHGVQKYAKHNFVTYEGPKWHSMYIRTVGS